jgi:YidC/Oxa1 family membrane protein insertase
MNKRAFFALLLSLLVISSYNYIIAKKYPPQLKSQQQRFATLPQPQQKETLSEFAGSLNLPKENHTFTAIVTDRDQDIVVETDLMRLVFTASGARVKSCQLKEYPEAKINIEGVKKKRQQIEQAIRQARAENRTFLLHELTKLELLLEKLAQQPSSVGAELVSLAALVDADFSPVIIFPNDEQASMALNSVLYRCTEKGLTLDKSQPEGVLEFIYSDEKKRIVKKIYSFSNYNYIIGLDIIFQGWSKEELSSEHFLFFNGPDVGMPQVQQGPKTYGYQGPITCFQSVGGQQKWVQKEKYGRAEKNVFIRREHKQNGNIIWTGLENKYFLSTVIPETAVVSVIVEKNKFEEKKVGLTVPWQGSGQYSFKLYLGPKQEKQLKEAGVSLEKAIDYGFFSPIAWLIYEILVFFFHWTQNFGWSIVLLGLTVKIVFYPLTHKSFESMQKLQQQMKHIQPEMKSLQEKYRDNPQKLNKEMMEFYRKKGINPLAGCQSGCLPMLLQIPVFLALYAVLYNSIELRGAHFIGWVTDLSIKDPYYVLPILMGVSMFAQQKLSGMGAGGGTQQEQAKLMAILMPILFTWIFANFPSGIVLYWLTFNSATALQQLLIRKKQEVPLT